MNRRCAVQPKRLAAIRLCYLHDIEYYKAIHKILLKFDSSFPRKIEQLTALYALAPEPTLKEIQKEMANYPENSIEREKLAYISYEF